MNIEELKKSIVLFEQTKASIIEKIDKVDKIEEKFKFLHQIKELDKDLNNYYRLIEENKEGKKGKSKNKKKQIPL